MEELLGAATAETVPSARPPTDSRRSYADTPTLDPATLPRDQVCFGATVIVKDVDLGDEEEYTLVGAGDENYDQGRILVTSPLGQGLLGKKIGQTAEIPAPKGSYELEIVAIRFDYLEG